MLCLRIEKCVVSEQGSDGNSIFLNTSNEASPSMYFMGPMKACYTKNSGIYGFFHPTAAKNPSDIDLSGVDSTPLGM